MLVGEVGGPVAALGVVLDHPLLLLLYHFVDPLHDSAVEFLLVFLVCSCLSDLTEHGKSALDHCCDVVCAGLVDREAVGEIFQLEVHRLVEFLQLVE